MCLEQKIMKESTYKIEFHTITQNETIHQIPNLTPDIQLRISDKCY